MGGLESREETPKEGMRGKRRTATNLAPNVSKARTQSLGLFACANMRRFCNSGRMLIFTRL